MFRFIVRFCLSQPCLSPVVFRSLQDLWAAKCFIPSPLFTLVIRCVKGWVVDVSWFKLHRKGQSLTPVLPFPTGQRRTPVWGSEQCLFVICTMTLLHRAQHTWLREIQAQICQSPWCHTKLQAFVLSHETLFDEKRSSHYNSWLCCIMTVSYAAGSSLLPKSLQNGSRN